MEQAHIALVGGLLFLMGVTGTVSAEGENPIAPPTTADSVPVAAASDGTSPQRAADIDASVVVSATANLLAVPTPEPNLWRSVVDGLRPSYWDASALPVQGMAMYYNPGVFKRVMDFRYEHSHISQCDECIGYAALLRAGDLDRRVWLQRKNHIAEGPFWVVDVAAPKHIPGLLNRNWVVDIDYTTAMRWRMAGPIPITVYAADSPEAQKFAAAYFSSEMIPLDERYIIPSEAGSYRTLDGEIESDETLQALPCVTETPRPPLPPAEKGEAEADSQSDEASALFQEERPD